LAGTPLAYSISDRNIGWKGWLNVNNRHFFSRLLIPVFVYFNTKYVVLAGSPGSTPVLLDSTQLGEHSVFSCFWRFIWGFHYAHALVICRFFVPDSQFSFSFFAFTYLELLIIFSMFLNRLTERCGLWKCYVNEKMYLPGFLLTSWGAVKTDQRIKLIEQIFGSFVNRAMT